MPESLDPESLNARDSHDADDETEVQQDGAIVQRLLRRKAKWRTHGNYRGFCNGCLYIGPIRSWWWLLELLTIIVTVTFIIEFRKYHLAVFVIGALLAATVFISSWKVLFCDPGIIPKKPFDDAVLHARRVTEMMKRGHSYPRQLQEFQGELVPHTYCFKCHVFRPPLTTHCSTCDACIVNVDHHCPVFGGCVARKNLYWFHAMAISMACYYPYMLITGLIGAAKGFLEGTVGSILLASIVADEVLVGIVLACTLTPLLAMTPCERRRDPFSSLNDLRGSGSPPRLSTFPNTRPYPRVSKEYTNIVSRYKPNEMPPSMLMLDVLNQNPAFVDRVSSCTSTT